MKGPIGKDRGKNIAEINSREKHEIKEETIQTSVYLPESLHKQLKFIAVEKSIRVNQLIVNALKEKYRK